MPRKKPRWKIDLLLCIFIVFVCAISAGLHDLHDMQTDGWSGYVKVKVVTSKCLRLRVIRGTVQDRRLV